MRSTKSLLQTDDRLQPATLVTNALSLYLFENVAIVAWRKASSASDIESLRDFVIEQKTLGHKGMSFIHIGHVHHTASGDEPRDLFARVLKEFHSFVMATAIITTARGFIPSVVRSVVTSLLVLTRLSHEIHFHHRAEEVLTWLPERHEQATGVKLDVDRLRALLLKVEATVMG